MGEVKKHFRPEFVNRIDEIVVFHALDEKNIEAIAKIQLAVLEKRLAKMELQLEVSGCRRLEQIAARRLRPGVRRAAAEARDPAEIENPLAKLILEGRFAAEGRDHGRRGKGRIAVREERPDEAQQVTLAAPAAA